MARVLISAVGNRDPYDEKNRNKGPILTTLDHLNTDSVLLVYNTPPAPRNMEQNALETEKALQQYQGVQVEMFPLELPDPTDYDAVLEAFRKTAEEISKKYIQDELLIAVSSGTPQMQAAWLLLISQGLLPAQAYYTSDPKYVTQEQSPVRSISVAFLQEDALLKTARRHFHSFHFHGAASTLNAFADGCQHSTRRKYALLLACYCKALGLWDDYRLGHAKNELLSVTKQIPNLKDQYEKICNLVEDQQKSKTEESLLILTDLFFNASRSLKRGQFADTLARVIRTYEGLLKWRLLHAHNTPPVLSRMEPDKRKEVVDFLEANGRRVDKKGYLMCDNIEMLLQEFYRDKEVLEWQEVIKQYKYARNKSIVAHGTDKVKEEIARKALEALRKILVENGADLNGYPLSDENLIAHEQELFSRLFQC